MNSTVYDKKLDELYNLLITKIDNNNINCKIQQLINKTINNKIEILEKNIESKINDKFVLLEKNIESKINDKFILLENDINNKIQKISKNIKNISFYLNLLYMENIYKNFNNINSFIFNDKSNILFKKKQTTAIKGFLIEENNDIKIKLSKEIYYNINYIILTFYTKADLINNYKFNFILDVTKIDNTTVIIKKNMCLEYEKFYEKYLDRTYNTIYFYKIDHLIDKINS
tara:strand:- start:106 stop:792 length:687 start_codon:yes stop_codon:yes gene_type:complete